VENASDEVPMRASVDWGGRSMSQFSQFGRSSSAIVTLRLSSWFLLVAGEAFDPAG